jgi:hypothetical protein
MSNSIERKPDNFDWVSARNNCSAAVIFEKLRNLIADDVGTRNTQLQRGAPVFRFELINATRYTVVFENHMMHTHDSVSFVLKDGQISAVGTERDIFTATVTLCDDGECRLKIGDKPYDLWQVRRMALEELFFRGGSS